MFYTGSGDSFHANCAIVPNADVSGIGVRTSFYLQATSLILLSLLPTNPHELLLSNLSIQIPTLALISSAYFDTAIDVPHTLIASHFAVLFSVSRMNIFQLKTEEMRVRRNARVLSRIVLLDVLFRWILVVFNFGVWGTILRLQENPEICPEGFGLWSFFGSVELRNQSSAVTFAYVYAILDIAWESLRLVIGFLRGWMTDPTIVDDGILLRIDPRAWFIFNGMYSTLFRCTFISTGKDRFMRQMWEYARYLTFLRQVAFLIFSVIFIEKSIQLNNLTPSENIWAFGQIFQIINTLLLVLQFLIIISRKYHITLLDTCTCLGQVLGFGLFIFVAQKGTAFLWAQHEKAYPGVFNNMRWYEYPIEMFCFGGTVFAGVMMAGFGVGLVVSGIMAVGAVGRGCALLARRWIGREIREAMLMRLNQVTKPLMEAIGTAEEEYIERGNGRGELS